MVQTKNMLDFEIPTCNLISSESMLESINDNPIATWRAPIPKLVQTPNKVHIIEITSIISPIHPKTQSPISGYKQDFIVNGSFSL